MAPVMGNYQEYYYDAWSELFVGNWQFNTTTIAPFINPLALN